MTKYFPVFLLPLCLVPAAFVPASALGADANPAQSLIALERQWVHAAATHDNATLARILADDFTDVSWRGQIRTKTDLLGARAAPASATQKLEDMHVRRYGNVGIVNGLNVITAKDRSREVRVSASPTSSSRKTVSGVPFPRKKPWSKRPGNENGRIG